MRRATGILVAALALLAPAGGAGATTRTVTSTADHGPGTLRHAVLDSLWGDTIEVPAGRYQLDRAIAVGTRVHIDGAGAEKTKLKAGPGHRIFSVFDAREVVFSDLTLTKGRAYYGGAIYNNGGLVLKRIILRGNRVKGVGGAISNTGTLDIDRSLFERNQGDLGGAIASGYSTPSFSGPVRITRSVFRGNRTNFNGSGGAIAYRSDTDTAVGLSLANSTVVRNEAIGGATYGQAEGGGISFTPGYGTGSRYLRISHSTIARNRTVAGRYSHGGGIAFDGSAYDAGSQTVLRIADSTLTGNAADGAGGKGGALYMSGYEDLGADTGQRLIDVTVASNTTDGEGGGIWTSPRIHEADLPVFTGSIVAGNAAGVGADCNTEVRSAGHNLESGTGCGFTAAGDLQSTEPLLAGLADNGGLTQTRALSPASPAIDAGSPVDCVASDQRGVLRPQGPDCDIGAFERIP